MSLNSIHECPDINVAWAETSSMACENGKPDSSLPACELLRGLGTLGSHIPLRPGA